MGFLPPVPILPFLNAAQSAIGRVRAPRRKSPAIERHSTGGLNEVSASNRIHCPRSSGPPMCRVIPVPSLRHKKLKLITRAGNEMRRRHSPCNINRRKVCPYRHNNRINRQSPAAANPTRWLVPSNVSRQPKRNTGQNRRNS